MEGGVVDIVFGSAITSGELKEIISKLVAGIEQLPVGMVNQKNWEEFRTRCSTCDEPGKIEESENLPFEMAVKFEEIY